VTLRLGAGRQMDGCLGFGGGAGFVDQTSEVGEVSIGKGGEVHLRGDGGAWDDGEGSTAGTTIRDGALTVGLGAVGFEEEDEEGV
jgi:hypothetical protein